MPFYAPRCPGCDECMLRLAARGVHYQCPTCNGRMLGIAPFKRLLADDLGAEVWTVSAAGELTSTCPFCHRPMRSASTSPVDPTGLAVCRACEQVWVPSTALSWLADNAAHPEEEEQPAARFPDECPDCGAPWDPDNAGRCHFCSRPLVASALFAPDPT